MEPPYISTALGAEGTWYTVLLSSFMTLPNPWSNPLFWPIHRMFCHYRFYRY
jgi:hypothetical protein